MSEKNPEDNFIVVEPRAVHYDANGRPKMEVGLYGNQEPEARVEMLAERLGVPKEKIERMDRSTKRGRVAVGFSRWRSKWDPHANKSNPNLN